MKKMVGVFLFSVVFLFSGEKEVREILERRWGGSTMTVGRINGGLTNENYLVTLGGVPYFLRYSSVDNQLLGVSLEGEWQVASKMALLGIAPKVLFHFPEDRMMLSEYIIALEERVNLRDIDMMKAFCQIVRTLHSSDVEFPTVFCPFTCIQEYMKNALDEGASLPSVFFERIFPEVENRRKVLPIATKVPCHLDLYSRNVLSKGDGLYLVDWEYAAMADPLFDLATAASADFFSDREMEQLLEIYLERVPFKEEMCYFYSMRILADVRWSLWAYLQAQISPLEGSFVEMGEDFLKEIIKRIGDGLWMQ
jgi:thiamine kinase-like enzyme